MMMVVDLYEIGEKEVPVHIRGTHGMVNERRQHVISNFDTKTIRVSSLPATFSYLTLLPRFIIRQEV